MTYVLLFLAVACNAVQNLIAKRYNQSVKNANTYVFSSLVAASAMVFFIIASCGKFDFDLGVLPYCIAFAVSYSAAMIGNVCAVSCGPLAISSLINQCSLIIPTLYGLAVLGERLTLCGYLGIAMVFACLFLVKPATSSDEKSQKVSPKWFAWVTVGFLGNGMCSCIQKMQQMKFTGGYKSEFMIVSLAIGMLVMLAMGAANSKDLKRDVKSALKFAPPSGAANGAVNLLVMILTALLPTAVLFPVILSGSAVITIVASIVIFGEKLTKKQFVGYALGAVSIVLVNI